MYNVVEATPTQITLIYIVFISASLLLFPICKLIYNAIERGIDQWK